MAEEVADPDEFVDYDFDESIRSRDAKAPRIRVYGQVYTLPRVIPAKMILIAQRLRTTKGAKADAQLDDVITLLRTVFGDNTEQILDSGIGLDELSDLIVAVQKVYERRSPGNAQDPDTPGEG